MLSATACRLRALRQRRHTEGRCASCECRSYGYYYCKKHRKEKALRDTRARAKKKAGRYLSLQKPQNTRRRVAIGYGFSRLKVDDRVLVCPTGDGGLKIRRTHLDSGLRVRRSATGVLFVSVAAADFPEDQFPVQKYAARHRGFWIMASAQPMPDSASPAGVAAHGGMDTVGPAGDLKPLAMEVVKTGSERPGGILDHGDDTGARRAG